ncbi:MAG: chorismate mutase [Spirochaetaceae bacterium]
MVLAVRGATTVDQDTKEQVIQRVQEMINKIFSDNNLNDKSIISILFSITEDIVSFNPAAALRANGEYSGIPLFCSAEPRSIGALKQAVRVIVTWNSEDSELNFDTKPVYLHNAKILRPDLLS